MISNKSQLGFALVGCGRISRKHAEALSGKVSQAKLVAVCDAKIDRARALGEEFAVPYFSDMKEMMEKKDWKVKL